VLEVLAAAGPEDEAAGSAQLGRFLIFTGDLEGAGPHLERALGLSEAFDFPETFVQALNSKGVLVSRQKRHREAAILVEGALHVALAHDLHAAALRAYNNLASILWQTDAWRLQIGHIDAALELARRVGSRDWESSFLAGGIGPRRLLGLWDEALENAAAAESLVATEFQEGLLLQRVTIHCHRGELEQARRLLDERAAMRDSENPDFSGGYLTMAGAVLAAEGRHDEALAAVRAALQAHGELGPPPGLRFMIFEAAGGIDDEAAIRELLAGLDALRPGEVTRSLRAQQARFRARLPEHDTEVELATAEQILRELEAPFDLAVVQLEHAEHLETQGRVEEAAVLLAEASETFTRLGAAPWLERARRIATGVPV
jgi:tetratricopeptide (TPR) repeat protein